MKRERKTKPLKDDLVLPWSTASTGAQTLSGEGFTAVVCPMLDAGVSVGFLWRTRVTVASRRSIDLFAEYGGCLTEYGMRLVERYLFDRAVGVPHAMAELRRLAGVKRGDRRGKTKVRT